MIRENDHWIEILPEEVANLPVAIAGQWLCFGDTQELHMYRNRLEILVEEGAFYAAKIARKDPRTDRFPHKPCVICVFTTSDREEIERVAAKLRDIGLHPSEWESSLAGTADCRPRGKVPLESEVVGKRQRLGDAEESMIDEFGTLAGVPREPSSEEWLALLPSSERAPSISVFISHSTKDRSFVEQTLLPVMQRSGIETWYSPQDIPNASQWEQTIREGLRKSEWLAVVVSENSIASPWVKAEVSWGFENIPDRVIPIVISDCDPGDLHLRLLPLQFVDYRQSCDLGNRQLLSIWGLDYAADCEYPRLLLEVHKVEGEPPTSVWLNVANGITIGRSCRADIAFPDWKYCSALHAIIKQRGPHTILVDTSSRNGTVVSGVRIEPNEEYTIFKGDAIRIAPVSKQCPVVVVKEILWAPEPRVADVPSTAIESEQLSEALIVEQCPSGLFRATPERRLEATMGALCTRMLLDILGPVCPFALLTDSSCTAPEIPATRENGSKGRRISEKTGQRQSADPIIVRVRNVRQRDECVAQAQGKDLMSILFSYFDTEELLDHFRKIMVSVSEDAKVDHEKKGLYRPSILHAIFVNPVVA